MLKIKEKKPKSFKNSIGRVNVILLLLLLYYNIGYTYVYIYTLHDEEDNSQLVSLSGIIVSPEKKKKRKKNQKKNHN